MLLFLQFLILFQLTLESSHLTLECIECLFEATGKVYFNSYDGAPDIEIIDAFLVWLQTIYPNAEVIIQGLQCQKPLRAKKLEVTMSFIGNGDLTKEELNNVLCSISEPQSSIFLQKLHLSEILSTVVESVGKKDEIEGKKRTTIVFFSGIFQCFLFHSHVMIQFESRMHKQLYT